MTIHKSQGKTFERVIIDLGQGAFAHGQSYVALSRCTTLEGITLRRAVTERDLMVDPEVREFLS
jgi:ATP-dependent exoDNAse (exonuclease V) alpha subunit